ncbi:hypothetical protein ACHZ98_14785 [Streptomyces sp. MAR4 CNY-716]
MTLTTRHRRRPRPLILAATAAGVLTIGGLGALAHATTGTDNPAGNAGSQESAAPTEKPGEPSPVPTESTAPSQKPGEPSPAPTESTAPTVMPGEPSLAPSDTATPTEEPREPTVVPSEPGTPTPLAPGEPSPEWRD